MRPCARSELLCLPSEGGLCQKGPPHSPHAPGIGAIVTVMQNRPSVFRRLSYHRVLLSQDSTFLLILLFSATDVSIIHTNSSSEIPLLIL